MSRASASLAKMPTQAFSSFDHWHGVNSLISARMLCVSLVMVSSRLLRATCSFGRLLARRSMNGIKHLGGSALLSGGGLLHRHEAQMVPHLGGRQLADDLVQVGRPHALDLVLERRQRVALGRLRRNR